MTALWFDEEEPLVPEAFFIHVVLQIGAPPLELASDTDQHEEYFKKFSALVDKTTKEKSTAPCQIKYRYSVYVQFELWFEKERRMPRAGNI